jgi:hypothetical protein
MSDSDDSDDYPRQSQPQARADSDNLTEQQLFNFVSKLTRTQLSMNASYRELQDTCSDLVRRLSDALSKNNTNTRTNQPFTRVKPAPSTSDLNNLPPVAIQSIKPVDMHEQAPWTWDELVTFYKDMDNPKLNDMYCPNVLRAGISSKTGLPIDLSMYIDNIKALEKDVIVFIKDSVGTAPSSSYELNTFQATKGYTRVVTRMLDNPVYRDFYGDSRGNYKINGFISKCLNKIRKKLESKTKKGGANPRENEGSEVSSY